jgi:LacI family transcriptional regulator
MDSQKKPVTIHDIARELGISGSTVSRALKNHPRISQATRDAVRKLADSYGYKPNTLATSLRTGKGNTVGVIVPNINRSFFSNIIAGIEEVLSIHGYNLMICQSYEKIEKEISALSTLMDARVDGILMSLSMETRDYAHLEETMKQGIPMVFFDRVPESLKTNSVVISDYLAAYKLTSSIINSGYQKLAHIGGSSGINVYRNRQQGFLDALKDAGIRPEKKWIVETEMTEKGGRMAFSGFVKQKSIPDAVICAGDYTALGVLQAARDLQIDVPGELAISGFANEEFTSLIDPSLSTVDQQGTEIGRIAAHSFMNYKESGEIQEIQVDSVIILRTSSRGYSAKSAGRNEQRSENAQAE